MGGSENYQDQKNPVEKVKTKKDIVVLNGGCSEVFQKSRISTSGNRLLDYKFSFWADTLLSLP